MKPEVNMSNEDAHIRILHLEDNPRDAQLMQDILETAGLSCDIVLVSSREEYDAALAGRQFDLVLCDYNLPDYDGLSALKLARQMQPDTPIIIISGTVEEEQAVKCLHLGATDYLLKQRLERFVPAVQRALQEAKELQRRRAADARIHEQASLLDQAKDAIIVRGIDYRVRYWNKGAERLYGWTAEEVIGRSIKDFLYHSFPDMYAATRRVLEQGEWRGEIMERRKDGTTLWVEANWTLLRNADGDPQSILAIKTDISRRKAAEHEIQHLAFHDSLTQLPNRQLLQNRLQHTLALCCRNRCSGALMLIDLDNFKTLNDTLGHDKGDLLLKQVAGRLKLEIPTSDTVARLGGDEFVVLLDDLSGNLFDAADEAKKISDKIFSAFIEPYQLDGYEHIATPSIGITLFNDCPTTVDEIMKHADLAMYEAKAAGRNAMRFFDPDMQKAVSNRAALEAEFRQGLQQREFLLHYQPQVDIYGSVIGVEALVRWHNPKRGLVSPAEFIPLAEETGLIVPLGRWVLETACAQLFEWATHPETAELTMAVNVSVRQFHRADFVELVLDILETTGADPCKLKLELTESLLVDDVEDTIAKMTALKANGVNFSLDDFGTGYSSLFYLKRLPLDQLKIDRSFVNEVLSDSDDAVIARTIVTLGQSLGLEVIAEGVETAPQRDFLARHGCRHFQGYLFSRPLPAKQINEFVQETNNRTGGILIRTAGQAKKAR